MTVDARAYAMTYASGDVTLGCKIMQTIMIEL